ncbi:MAG: hypothetical protein PHZ02_14515 [Desulfocapsaceae bacterium]|nr:hypothetical protein [Desulfocapsaceae bacterium]
MFLHLLRQHKKSDTAESGFVLVTTLGILLIISLIGAWALNTSMFELKVAGGLLRFERQFNVAEGGANTEAAKVGFFLPPYDTFPDPTDFGKRLIPTTELAFDPGNDTVHTLAELNVILATATAYVPPDNWPWQNLLNDNTASANEFDYRYLVTYLDYGNVIGSSAGAFSGYNFRVQGAAPLVVEMGGTKLGPKVSL